MLFANVPMEKNTGKFVGWRWAKNKYNVFTSFGSLIGLNFFLFFFYETCCSSVQCLQYPGRTGYVHLTWIDVLVSVIKSDVQLVGLKVSSASLHHKNCSIFIRDEISFTFSSCTWQARDQLPFSNTSYRRKSCYKFQYNRTKLLRTARL